MALNFPLYSLLSLSSKSVFPLRIFLSFFISFFFLDTGAVTSVIKFPYSTTISLKVPQKAYFNVFSLQ